MEETEVEALLPFTLEDAESGACSSCEYVGNCPIIVYVNKLSVKRDGRGAEDEFSCTFHKEVDLDELTDPNNEEV